MWAGINALQAGQSNGKKYFYGNDLNNNLSSH